MIRVHDRLLDEGLKSRLILQVHDELLIETKAAEKDKVLKLLEKEMRGAVDMKVSMEVGTECGYDWYDCLLYTSHLRVRKKTAMYYLVFL